MVKNFYKTASILLLSSLIAACGNIGQSSSTNPSTNTWQLVGNTLPWDNVSFNAVAVSSTGFVFAGGTADVNNGLVVGNIAPGGAWQLIGTAYIPNPNTYIVQTALLPYQLPMWFMLLQASTIQQALFIV